MPYPKWNTVPIKCGNQKCDWTGMESDLKPLLDPDPNPLRCTRNVCPKCECESYSFIVVKH